MHLSAANRRMIDVALESNDAALVGLLRHRQRLNDFYSFALEIDRGRIWSALGYAHWDNPAQAIRQLRLAAGAARQRLTRMSTQR